MDDRYDERAQDRAGVTTSASARPRWRDAFVVTVLAIVLLAGLVHYGGQLADDRAEAPAAGGPATSTAPDPQGGATAELESTEPTPPTDPASPPAPTDECWDGRPVAALRLCGDPQGEAGLKWVFPSFRRQVESEPARCQPVADQSARNYATVVSFLCRERALGKPVSVVYDQVADPAQVAAWLRSKPGAQLVDQPGAHGGRLLAVDTAKQPARITGTYVKFPFVVSVFAPDGATAERAWKRLVEQRPPQAVRGRPA